MADLTSINIFKQKLSLKWQIDFDFDIAYTANDQIRVEDDTQFTEFARWIKESSPQGEVKVPFSNVLVSKTDKTYAPIVIKLVAKDSQLTDTLNQTVDVTDSVSMSASDRQGQFTNALYLPRSSRRVRLTSSSRPSTSSAIAVMRGLPREACCASE